MLYQKVTLNLHPTPFFLCLPVTEGLDFHGLRSGVRRQSVCGTWEGSDRVWGVISHTAPVCFRQLSRRRLLSTVTLSMSQGVWLVSGGMWVCGDWEDEHPHKHIQACLPLFSLLCVQHHYSNCNWNYPTGIRANALGGLHLNHFRQSYVHVFKGKENISYYFSVWCNSFS